METILEVKELVKHFREVRAVDGISFSIPKGTCFGLLGPNGAGKTTAIEVVEGIQPATSGTILYKGRPRQGNRFREEVGIQLQSTELPQFLSVRETLDMYLNLYTRRLDIHKLMDMCHITSIAERDNRKISGGQKQRLLLAIALANRPELVFLDEPTTGLDPQARRHLWDIVSDIKNEGKTIILTTHYMEEAQILCDNVVVMDEGRIMAMGSPRELLSRTQNRTTIGLKGDFGEMDFRFLPCEATKIQGGFELKTDDLNGCIKGLMSQDVDFNEMSVRSKNLEDLFLELTGKELRS